jgi:hypothetical protein
MLIVGGWRGRSLSRRLPARVTRTADPRLRASTDRASRLIEHELGAVADVPGVPRAPAAVRGCCTGSATQPTTCRTVGGAGRGTGPTG